MGVSMYLIGSVIVASELLSRCPLSIISIFTSKMMQVQCYSINASKVTVLCLQPYIMNDFFRLAALLVIYFLPPW